MFGGSDNIRDAWSPFGNGDMLERAMMIGYRANFRHDEELALAFDMVTAAAARVLGIADYGIEVGGPADFVVVEAGSLAEAVATRPRRKLVIKAGRIVARDGVLVSLNLGIDNGVASGRARHGAGLLLLRLGPRLRAASSFLLDDARTALVGENGAGKSTLLKCLTGELELNGGKVIRSRGLRVGSVPQDVPAGLADLPVRDVLQRSLAKVGLGDD